MASFFSVSPKPKSGGVISTAVFHLGNGLFGRGSNGGGGAITTNPPAYSPVVQNRAPVGRPVLFAGNTAGPVRSTGPVPATFNGSTIFANPIAHPASFTALR